MTDNLYFAYGANINQLSMSYRCPQAQPVSSLLLRGWRLEFHTHATIVPDSRGVVPGALWRLTPACEASLDAFEGYPYYYRKHTWMQDGRQFFFYVMNEGKISTPSQGYVNNIREGYQQWGLPEEAIDQSINLCYN